jgi:class 3 adenylate cyclase
LFRSDAFYYNSFMPDPVFYFDWRWDLRSAPEQLWPLITDTGRFNRVSAAPQIDRFTEPEGPGLQSRRMWLHQLFVHIEWDEYPFEWIRPRRFGSLRVGRRGPIGEMRTLADLDPRPDGGTRLRYQVWVRPGNLLGRLTIPLQIGVINRREFERTFRRIDAFVQNPRAAPHPYHDAHTHVSGAGAQRLAALAGGLVQSGYDAALVQRLVDCVTYAADEEVVHLRAYALADQWGAPRRRVLELCLAATRAGLLDLSWDLLCPLCRGIKASVPHLDQLSGDVHCAACQIDVRADFDRGVEATFRPNAAVRRVEVVEYCIGGPQVTPHIVAQQRLDAGETRSLDLALEPGAHRIRARSVPGAVQAHVAGGAAGAAELALAEQGWTTAELAVEPHVRLALHNRSDRAQLIVLERTAWNDQATTAADLSTVQLFRDLFAGEALRPGERLGIQNLAVLFTDLRGSTQLYREIGDAPAFGRVLAHFDLLRAAVDEHQGALVKTIGDSIMAAFLDPGAGVRAALAILRAMHDLNAQQPDRPLSLKLGLHAGPAIAVTLNERLDYFGTTVNLASRMEGQAHGDDLILSAAVLRDPGVQQALAETPTRVEPFSALLKGFVGEEFELYRVTLAERG